jgi:HSP20 family protein
MDCGVILFQTTNIMIPHPQVIDEGLVYPGAYVPRTELESRYSNLCLNACEAAAEKPVNIEEEQDCYKMAIAMPGLRREDILIFVHDHILSIGIHHYTAEQLLLPERLMQQGGMRDTEKHIQLPDTADAEFISAEYQKGILNLFISKNPSGSKVNNRQVVVY